MKDKENHPSITYGEYLVGKAFNPSGDDKVAEIKAASAALIDMIQESCGEERCTSLAIANIEQGAMWAVKAVTKPVDPDHS